MELNGNIRQKNKIEMSSRKSCKVERKCIGDKYLKHAPTRIRGS